MILTQPRTFAELHEALGEVPLERILMEPPPGTVSEEDYLEAISQREGHYELVDGTIVAKEIYPDDMIRCPTMLDIYQALGEIPLERIRMIPPPGTATEQDLLLNNENGDGLCELIDGILVEKAMECLRRGLQVDCSLIYHTTFTP